MKSKVFSATAVAVALSTAAFLSPAQAQQKAKLYAFHSSPVIGGCPGLDWQITVQPNDDLSGFVAWDKGQHMARLVGKLNKDRTFTMNAHEIGGQARKATVTGTAGGDYINAMVHGSGTACDDMNLAIPWHSTGLAGGGG